MTRTPTRRFLVVAVVLSSGCSRSEPERYSLPPSTAPIVTATAHASSMAIATSTGASAHTMDAASTANAAGELAWTVPAKWQTVPNPSSMRKATYRVSKAAGDPEDAEMSVTEAGGSLDANIDRWAGQFEGPKVKRAETTAGGMRVTVVEIEGALRGGAPMAGGPPAEPKKGYALLGAIVAVAETGGGTTFFKLTGPAKTVAAARPEFDALVASFRRGGAQARP